MTKSEFVAEIESIRDLLIGAPEVCKSRQNVNLNDIDEYFEACDELDGAVTEAVGRLDDLACENIENDTEEDA